MIGLQWSQCCLCISENEKLLIPEAIQEYFMGLVKEWDILADVFGELQLEILMI